MTLHAAMHRMRRRLLNLYLRKAGWNVSAAARLAGIPRVQFYRYMRVAHIKRPVAAHRVPKREIEWREMRAV